MSFQTPIWNLVDETRKRYQDPESSLYTTRLSIQDDVLEFFDFLEHKENATGVKASRFDFVKHKN